MTFQVVDQGKKTALSGSDNSEVMWRTSLKATVNCSPAPLTVHSCVSVSQQHNQFFNFKLNFSVNILINQAGLINRNIN